MVIATIWENWNNQVLSCALITQEANEKFAPIHDRMPLTLTSEEAARWIDPGEDATTLIADLKGHTLTLVPQAVSPAVTNARNKGELISLGS